MKKETITREELNGNLDAFSKYIKTKNVFIRCVFLMAIFACMLFFVGFGNQSLIQYGVAGAMALFAYILGRIDLKARVSTKGVIELKNSVDKIRTVTFEELNDSISEYRVIAE